ncbi:MAG: RNA-binding protein [Candidatus Levybacteria bacterium]|nr:RNA-binding protein [Candidatus Levybacteria bacterium]
MAKNLFVAGLSYDTTSDSLNKHFSEVGTVTSAQVIMDKYTNQSKGFGFVEMSTDEEARLAMDKLNGSTLDNRTIVVKEARPREEFGQRRGQRNNFQRRDNKSSRNRY